MAKRAWQKVATKAGCCVGLAGLTMFFGGAGMVALNQISTGVKSGQNKYEIVGLTATAPTEAQAKGMMFSLAGAPFIVLGFVSLLGGEIALSEKKKDKGGPAP